MYFGLGQFEEAASLLKRRIIRKPDTDISRVLLAATYGYLGRSGDARAQWAMPSRRIPTFRSSSAGGCFPIETLRISSKLSKVYVRPE